MLKKRVRYIPLNNQELPKHREYVIRRFMANILTTEEITELKNRHGQERDRRVCDRIKAVLLYDKGWSLQEIAEALLLSDESIRKHIRDYQQAKKLRPENGGSESKLGVQDTNELKEHLAKNTYQYVKNICSYVKDKYGKKYYYWWYEIMANK
jgi:transposase